jgi:hypothetical protein
METADLRALLAAHPAVAIAPGHGRPGTLCVRVGDLARIVAEAGHQVDDGELERLVSALDGQRLLLVDPTGRATPAAGRGRSGGRAARPAKRPRGKAAKPLDDLAVYELPARAFRQP